MMERIRWLLMLVVCLLSKSVIDCEARKIGDDDDDGRARLIANPFAFREEVMEEQKRVIDTFADDDDDDVKSDLNEETVLKEQGSEVTQNPIVLNSSPASTPANITKSPLDFEVPNNDANSEELENPGNLGKGQQLMGTTTTQLINPFDKNRMNPPSWMNRFREQGPFTKFPSSIPSLEYLDPRVNYELPYLFHFKHVHGGNKYLIQLMKEVPETVVPVESIPLLGHGAVWKLSKDDVVERFRGLDSGDEAVITNFNGYIVTKLVDGFPRRFLIFLYNVGNKTFALEPHEMYLHDSFERKNTSFQDPEHLNINRMAHLIFDVTQKDEVDILILVSVMGDYSMFENVLLLERDFSSENVRNASHKTHFYLWNVGNKTASSFENIKSKGLNVALTVVGTNVAMMPEKSEFIESSKLGPGVIDGDAALKKFENSMLEVQENEEWKSVRVVLTRYQIMSDGKMVSGVSSSQNLCSPGFIILHDEEFYLSSNLLSKHVALSIGIGYDGDQNTCHESDGFIMSENQTVPSLKNSERFSSCASEYFKKVLEENHGKDCLNTEVDLDYVNWKNPFIGYYPGEVFSISEQCQLVFGKGYTFEWPESTDRICEVVTCRDLSGNDSRSLPLMRAFEGTSCRDGAWCINNFCTYDVRAPKVLRRGGLGSDDSVDQEEGLQDSYVNVVMTSVNLVVSVCILICLIFLIFWSKSKWSKIGQESRMMEEGYFAYLKKCNESKED